MARGACDGTEAAPSEDSDIHAVAPPTTRLAPAMVAATLPQTTDLAVAAEAC